MRRAAIACAAAGAVALWTGLVRADVNPFFTPVHLVRQSDVIAVVECDQPDTRGRVTVHVQRVIKEVLGRAPKKPFVVDLSAVGLKPLTEAAVRLVEDARKSRDPMLFFEGRYVEEASNEVTHGVCLYLGGRWFILYRGEDGGLGLDGIDMNLPPQNWGMQATWNGGPDMLLRCVTYILNDPRAEVPVASGVEWDQKTRIATIAGTVHGLQAVDLTGDGTLVLFAASDAGDRLLAFDDVKKPFQDVTGRHLLASTSVEAAWADFDGNGRLDLASWDGKALTLWLQGADGRFKPEAVEVALENGCVGLAVIDVGVKGRPGLVVSSAAGPLILSPAEKGFHLRPLGPLPKRDESAGKPAAALVADFDGDAIPDILQPFEKCGYLCKGRRLGDFDQPREVAVAMGKLPGRACTADLDQDGLLDVFVAATDYAKLYQNHGALKFEETIFRSGEIAYISKPDAIDVQVCDINNDGRQDLLTTYSNLSPLIFFSRGFRVLEHANTLDLGEQGLLDETREGTQGALIADFNGDGAQDFIVVDPKGGAWIFYRAIHDAKTTAALRVVLPPGQGYAGPLTVTGWARTRCLGAWNAVAGSQEAFLARGGAGPVTIRWRFPGGQPQEKEIILEDKPIRLLLEPEK